MMGFLIVSFCSKGLNRIWHAGMMPAGYLYRNSFVTIFMIIRCAALCLPGAQDREVLCAGKDHQPEHQPGRENVNDRGAGGAVLSVLLLSAGILFCIANVNELYGNAGHIMDVLQTMAESSVSAFAEQTAAHSLIWETIRGQDPGLYRMETVIPYTENDSMMYGYNGVSHYSSVQQTQIRRFLSHLGFNDTGLLILYSETNTHAADMLLGLRYTVYEDHIEDNRPVLPLAYTADLPIENHQVEPRDPFLYQQEMFRRAAGGDAACAADFFSVPEIIEHTEDEYLLRASADGRMYLYILGTDLEPQNILVETNGEFCGEFGNSSCRNMVELGNYSKDELIRVRLSNMSPPAAEEDILFATENTEAENAAAAALVQNAAQIEMLSSSHYRIHTEPQAGDPGADKRGSYLVLLIPYSRDWHAAVNGKTVKPELYMDTFMRIPLERNTAAEVDLQYIPGGFRTGAAISLLAFAVMIIWIGETALRSRKKK